MLVECLCCHASQPFHFSSSSDQVVCPYCARHLGDDRAVQRDAQHIALWASLLEDAESRFDDATSAAQVALDEADVRITVLTAQVGELSRIIAGDIDSAAESPSRTLLETEALGRARRRAELAARGNDAVFAALWAINARHGDAGALCACGEAITDCPDRAVLAPVRGRIADWEARNLALLAQGTRHALPAGHPAMR